MLLKASRAARPRCNLCLPPRIDQRSTTRPQKMTRRTPRAQWADGDRRLDLKEKTPSRRKASGKAHIICLNLLSFPYPSYLTLYQDTFWPSRGGQVFPRRIPSRQYLLSKRPAPCAEQVLLAPCAAAYARLLHGDRHPRGCAISPPSIRREVDGTGSAKTRVALFATTAFIVRLIVRILQGRARHRREALRPHGRGSDLVLRTRRQVDRRRASHI